MQRNTTGTFRATNTWKKTYLQSAQKCTFNQMNKYCISQGSVVTFFTWMVGKFTVIVHFILR